jgi:hypothetical protein
VIFEVLVQNKSVRSATYLCAIVIPTVYDQTCSKIQNRVKNDVCDENLFFKIFLKAYLFYDSDKPNLCLYSKYEQKNLSVTMSTKIVIQYIF